MNIQKLLRRCYDRHKQPLSQVRTAMQATKEYVNHSAIPNVYYAYRKMAPATAFTDAGISIVPIRRDRIMLDGRRSTGPVCSFSKALNANIAGWDPWKTTFTFEHWEEGYWKQSYGIQSFTGYPSDYWTDLDFEWDAIEQHPHETGICISRLLQLAEAPLLTISKSGGLRFSCRTPGYIHPRPESEREYAARYAEELDENGKPVREKLFLEIFGDKGTTRWDSRYEIVCGNLFNPPTIPYTEIFHVIKDYRQTVHRPPPIQVRHPKARRQNAKQRVANSQTQVAKWTMNNLPDDIQWVKDRGGGFKSKRGDYKCTMDLHPKSGGRNLQFYMDIDGKVAIFCHNCRNRSIIGQRPKSEREQIAELIKNAPPAESTPSLEQQREWKIDRIRNYEISTLELQRPLQVLFKQHDQTEYASLESNDEKIRNAFDRSERLILLNAETGAGKNFQMEEAIKDGLKIIKTAPTKPLAIADEARMKERGIDVSLWKPRSWLADLQRTRIEEDKLVDPFKDGAVCIYPEQCDALFMRGGNARRFICPNCEVFEQCQSDGYLSQHGMAIGSEVIVIAMPDLFFNPNRQSFTDALLLTMVINEDGEMVEEKHGRVGTIDEAKAHEFYRRCSLSREQLKIWRDMWGEERMLGMFAIDMLYLLESKGFEIEALRKYICTLDAQIDGTPETIHRQMQHLLFPGEIFKRGINDPQSGKPLAYYSIRFECGTDVYIATSDYAYKALIKMEELCVGPREYKKHDMIEVTQEQAMRFGIYNVSQNRPEDYKKVGWVAGSSTHLHQLIKFFKNYTVNENSPMFYDGEDLKWYLPPTLHPNLKNLVMMSATLNLEHAKHSFPEIDEEDIATIQTQPTAWKPGSKVFQIRTGVYPRRSLMDSEQVDGAYEYSAMTDTGGKFFGFIEDAIKSNPDREHAIITFKQIVDWLKDDWQSKYDNVAFFGHFGKMEGLDEVFKEVKDYWIIGSPEVGLEIIKHTAKLIFGNREIPISFERDDDKMYVDPDVQSVYEACVVALLQQAVGRARLNRIPDNRVFIFSGVHIPTVTDRAETLLFDFADCEIARSVDELEHWIRIRERDERNTSVIYEEILDALIAGQTASSLYRQEEYPEYLVRKIQEAHRDEIQEAITAHENQMRQRVQDLKDRGDSWKTIKDDTGISEYKAKKLLGLL